MSNLDDIAVQQSPIFSGDESTTEIAKKISDIVDGDADIDLSSGDIQYVAKQIRAGFPIAKRLPKLIAKWGVAPELGTRCSPEFLLVCGEDYSGAELDVEFAIDDELDYLSSDTNPRPKKTSEQHWIFKFPFSLTTRGVNCLSGIYNMKLELEFANLTDPLLPKHLYCEIRLIIPNADASKRVLEIDSDDKSIVNLQGLNLQQFSKVTLKGSGSGLINILQGQQNESAEEAGDADENDIAQAYPLQVATKHDVNELWQSNVKTKRPQLKKACLKLPDGENVILLSQHRIRFGRSRDTDIVVRFLPRNDDNDGKSRNLSREHCVATIVEEGIHFQDQSSSGIALDLEVVKDNFTLEPESFKREIQFSMGGVLSAKQLELLLVPLVSVEHTAVYQKEHRRLTSFAISSDLRWGKLWSVAHRLKLDAIRIERDNNLNKEKYVVICQQANIGSSNTKCAIVVNGIPKVAARLLYIDRGFWLNKITGNWDVSVDGHTLNNNEMVPLSPDYEIIIDGVKMTFERHNQLHL